MTPHVHDRLAYYRDLTPDERQAVDAHLAGCAECRATLDAYRGQDAALQALPALRPRRPRLAGGVFAPRRVSAGRLALTRLGDGLALTGLAALLWFFALQVQAAAQGGLGTLAPAALEPGLTLPPTRLEPPSPWLPALPWLAASLLVVGGLFILTRRSLIPTVVGGLAAGLLLTSFVPPFSAAPNPAGLYWRVAGGYTYDPRLPFRNSFLIAGDPAQSLRPYLDDLIGKTGLAPLDPVQPLARTEVLQVGLHPTHRRVALVTTRFLYADGSSRVYPVPLFDPVVDVFGFWLSGWREDGLQRLRSEHLDFPGQPFADESSPIQLGDARRLDLHPEASRLDEANPGHWLWESVRVDRLVVAPDASALLVAIEQDAGVRQLWRVPFDGAPPVPVGPSGDIHEYGWSPDSQHIVYTRFDPDAAAVDPTRPYAIVSVARSALEASSRVERGYGAPVNVATGLDTEQLPGLTVDGIWFFHNQTLWRAPYAGGAPTAVRSDLASAYAPRPSPDGARVAFRQIGQLCLADVAGGEAVCVPGVRPAEIAWSPDGARLAVVDRDANNLRPVRLAIVSRAGELEGTHEIAPRDVADPPQWMPDGRTLLIQTFPQDGRRIIAVDLALGQVVDLSREHWDAYFTLMPDGRSLLLNNGRGDFWHADVLIDR